MEKGVEVACDLNGRGGYGRPMSFLFLEYGKGFAFKGNNSGFLEEENQEIGDKVDVELADPRQLGIVTLGELKEHLRIVKLKNGQLVLEFLEQGFEKPFYSQKMSDGTLKLFALPLLFQGEYVKTMKKRGKTMLRVLLCLAAIIVILILICFVYHRYSLKAEKKWREPLGQMIDINGNNMSIYVEGSGLKTLVFLSGSGTCSPILDFKSLYSLLSDDYRIVVVEKFGYGYSDVVDEDRNIQTILSETRSALNKAGIEGPYVLCPHSMSGIEALYWAQEYPDEIEAIVGLDMAVPEYYENMEISIPLMKLGQYAANLGITRVIPGLAESDAIKYGTLTEDEKNIYRAVFYNRTATKTMINEAKSIKENAKIVAQNGVPQVAMLLFISDGTGGTGFDKETWRRIPKEYILQVESGKYIELDCPHYVHDYEYERISEEMKRFLGD